MSTKAFERVMQAVRQQDFYILHGSSSNGRMVDTWHRNGVTVQVIDDGDVAMIRTTGLQVSRNRERDLTYREGTFEELISTASLF